MVKRAALWLTLGSLATAIAVCGPIWAAEPAASWGVVDMGRVATEYRGMHNLERQFQEFQREQDQMLDGRYKTRALYDDERQEFFDLSDMGAPTEERDKRLAELAGLSDKRENRLLELRQNKERTPGEEEEFRQLTALYDQRMGELAALQTSLQQAREAKRAELNRVLTDSVNSAVKAVAEERGLPIVVRREIVLYGGTDITEDVLTKLNAEEATETAEAEATEAAEPAEE
jgi:Skp family chaperone for outer membrane proteins